MTVTVLLALAVLAVWFWQHHRPSKTVYLDPGMAATVEIGTNNINDVTLIPNAAMRFTTQQDAFPGMYDDSRCDRPLDDQVLQLDRLPNWTSLKLTKNDPVLVEALRRTLVPAVNVIVDGPGESRD